MEAEDLLCQPPKGKEEKKKNNFVNIWCNSAFLHCFSANKEDGKSKEKLEHLYKWLEAW